MGRPARRAAPPESVAGTLAGGAEAVRRRRVGGNLVRLDQAPDRTRKQAERIPQIARDPAEFVISAEAQLLPCVPQTRRMPGGGVEFGKQTAEVALPAS